MQVRKRHIGAAAVALVASTSLGGGLAQADDGTYSIQGCTFLVSVTQHQAATSHNDADCGTVKITLYWSQGSTSGTAVDGFHNTPAIVNRPFGTTTTSGAGCAKVKATGVAYCGTRYP